MVENVTVVECILVYRRNDLNSFFAFPDVKLLVGVGYDNNAYNEGTQGTHARLEHVTLSVDFHLEAFSELVDTQGLSLRVAT